MKRAARGPVLSCFLYRHIAGDYVDDVCACKAFVYVGLRDQMKAAAIGAEFSKIEAAISSPISCVNSENAFSWPSRPASSSSNFIVQLHTPSPGGQTDIFKTGSPSSVSMSTNICPYTSLSNS